MKRETDKILTLNAGSSSIKFAVYTNQPVPILIMSGQMESIGTDQTTLNYVYDNTKQENSISIRTSGNQQAAGVLLSWLKQQAGFASIKVIGHRIVYGMKHKAATVVTPALLVELNGLSNYDPEHMPAELWLIKNIKVQFPEILQIACFDTAFHATMPPLAKLLPLPEKYRRNGIERYGFHGISYAFLMEELEKVAGKEAANGKVILAHLGNGASLCAVQNGKSMDTTMGFTPVSGIPMATRTGDLDPGVAWYLMHIEKMTSVEFSHLINHKSGLLGISGTSSDMRDLLKVEDTDERAKTAIEFFCYQAKKSIGAFTTVLEGLDTLVFSGGIGENAPEIRARICNGLKYSGIEIDEVRNQANEPVISSENSRVCVRVIKTNEQLMIAKTAYKLFKEKIK